MRQGEKFLSADTAWKTFVHTSGSNVIESKLHFQYDDYVEQVISLSFGRNKNEMWWRPWSVIHLNTLVAYTRGRYKYCFLNSKHNRDAFLEFRFAIVFVGCHCRWLPAVIWRVFFFFFNFILVPFHRTSFINKPSRFVIIIQWTRAAAAALCSCTRAKENTLLLKSRVPKSPNGGSLRTERTNDNDKNIAWVRGVDKDFRNARFSSIVRRRVSIKYCVPRKCFLRDDLRVGT